MRRERYHGGVRSLAPWLSVLMALGCAEEAPDVTPEGALAAFIDAMEESRYDDARRADAYALLDQATQAELEDRVARGEALGRAGLEPWEMLVMGRFRLAFEPYSMRARVENGEGVVVVRGRNGEQAEVPVIQEPGGWRVRLLGLTEPETNAEPEPEP